MGGRPPRKSPTPSNSEPTVEPRPHAITESMLHSRWSIGLSIRLTKRLAMLFVLTRVPVISPDIC